MIEHVSLKHQTNGRRQGVAEAQEMHALGHIIERLTTSVDNAETWIEMVRDLREPIPLEFPDIAFNIRWAEKADIVEIAALEGFVKEIDVMARSLRHGDRCILFEKMGRIVAFAWIAFRDYRLSVWRKLHLPTDAAYLVYIFVISEFRRKGAGLYLLRCVMRRLRQRGYTRLVSGMYANWEASISLHVKAGFRIDKKFVKRKLLQIIPVPPRKLEVGH